MPLQNRVDPFGSIHAVSARGAMMGNRGGRIHDPASKSIKRRFASKRWIACVCQFRGRKRTVMGNSYTELFFLDEVTALAAGHRPCAECRNADFKRFSSIWKQAFGLADMPKAGEMDAVLHRERSVSGTGPQTLDARALPAIPDGAMIAQNGIAWALRAQTALRWSFEGYGRPVQFGAFEGTVSLLTPPGIVKALKTGYQAAWHSSADR